MCVCVCVCVANFEFLVNLGNLTLKGYGIWVMGGEHQVHQVNFLDFLVIFSDLTLNGQGQGNAKLG